MDDSCLIAKPNKLGTAIVTMSPLDEDGEAVEFSMLSDPKWQLMTAGGDIVDGCAFGDNVLTSLEWVLKGTDLALFGDTDNGVRAVTFKATYNSDAGADLPLNATCLLQVLDIIGIS